MVSFGFKELFNRLNQGLLPYLMVLAHLIAGTLLVFILPRSNLAFLVLVTSFLSLYVFETDLRFKLITGAFLALVIIPVIGVRNIFYLEVIFQISVFAALALGLNIVVGFAGLLDLGYVAFYAVGAYLWAFFGSQQYYVLHFAPGTQPSNLPFLLPGDAFFVFLLLGIVVAGLVGILLGLPVLRVKGDYLAIVTLGFGEVIRVMANNLDKPLNFTNGPQGITPIQRPSMPDSLVDGFNTIFGPIVGHHVSPADMYNLMFYILALMVIIVIIFVTRRLDDSKMGRAWTAVREDETAAIAMGIPLVKTKLSAFAVGASFAGIMGVLLAANRTFISPESFSFMQSIGVLAMVILGGAGSIPGVILGAATITILNLQVLQGFSLYLNELRQSEAVIPIINFAWKNLSTQLDPAKYQRLLFGLILILMMIFRPSGLIPSVRRKRKLDQKETK
ncbi:MAG: branched-chain amino acid ABC transporter permease [Pseudomonadota bacterium]